jgi:hypothetical protein
MPQAIQIEQKEGYLHVVVSGSFDGTKANQFIRQILNAAKQHSLSKALVDIRKLEGAIPTAARFELGELWAAEASTIQAAILELPEQVIGRQFFEDVVVNRGGRIKIFTTTCGEALEWLGIEPANNSIQATPNGAPDG